MTATTTGILMRMKMGMMAPRQSMPSPPTKTACTIYPAMSLNGYLTGPMPILASGGIATTSNFLSGGVGSPIGLFKTVQSNDDLILNLSGAANVGGHISIFVFNG